MNRIYKVIWSRTKGQYVVVSELTRSCTKRVGRRTGRRLAAMVASLILTAGVGGMSVEAVDAVPQNQELLNEIIQDQGGSSSDLVTLAAVPAPSASAAAQAPLAESDEQPGEEPARQHTIVNEDGFYADNGKGTYNTLSKDGLWVGGTKDGEGFYVDNDGNMYTTENAEIDGSLSVADGRATIAEDGTTLIQAGDSQLRVADGSAGMSSGNGLIAVSNNNATVSGAGNVIEAGINGITMTEKTGNSVTIDRDGTTVEGDLSVVNGAFSAANGNATIAEDGTTLIQTGNSQLHIADDVAGMSSGNGLVAVSNNNATVSGAGNVIEAGINGITMTEKSGNSVTISRDGTTVDGDLSVVNGAFSAANGNATIAEDGTTLIQAGDSQLHVADGVAGMSSGNSSVSVSNNSASLEGANNQIILDTNGITIAEQSGHSVTIDRSGTTVNSDLTVNGKLTADEGVIGDVTLADGTVTADTINVENIEAGNAHITNDLVVDGAFSAANGRATIAEDGTTLIRAGDSQLRVADGSAGMSSGNGLVAVSNNNATVSGAGNVIEAGINGITMTEKTGNSVTIDRDGTTVDGDLSVVNGVFSAANGNATIAEDGTTLIQAGDSQLHVADDVAGMSSGNSSVSVSNNSASLESANNQIILDTNGITIAEQSGNSVTIDRDGTTVNSDLTVNGKLTADEGAIGDVTLADGTVTADTINVENIEAGNAHIEGSAVVDGGLTAGNVTTEGQLSAGSAVISGNATIGGIATVGGLTTEGNITAHNITANNELTAGKANVEGTITAGSAHIEGSAAVDGGLTAGNVTTEGQLSAGNAVINGNATIGGTATVGGLTTEGNITAHNITAENELTAGKANVEGLLTAGSAKIDNVAIGVGDEAINVNNNKFMVYDDGAFRAANSNFIVKNNGDMTASAAHVDNVTIDNNEITGLSNTTWDVANVDEDRAATEGQLMTVQGSVDDLEDKTSHIEHVTDPAQGGDYTAVEGTKFYADGSVSSSVSGMFGDSQYLDFNGDGLTISKEDMWSGSTTTTTIDGGKITVTDEYDHSTTIDGGSVTTEQLTVNADVDNRLQFNTNGLNVNAGDSQLNVNENGLSLNVDDGAGRNNTVKVEQDGTTFSYTEGGASQATATVIKGSTITAGDITIDGTADKASITGLSNTTWTGDEADIVANRAATEGQLMTVQGSVDDLEGKTAHIEHVTDPAQGGDYTAVEGTKFYADGKISNANDSFTVEADGSMKATGAAIDNVVIGADDSSAINVNNGKFMVYDNGAFQAAGRQFIVDNNGEMTASAAHVDSVTIDNDEVTGLSNTTWTSDEADIVASRAATEGQLQTVQNTIESNVSEAIGTGDFSRTNYAKGAGDVTEAIYDVDAQVKANSDVLDAYEDAGIVAGTVAETGTDSIALGNGANIIQIDGQNAPSNAIAIGTNARASMNNAVAVGYNSNAAGENSLALGYGASTTYGGWNSVAIGFGSIASENNVVSIGNSETQRRIVNVADGENDTDAATVGQLNNAVADATKDAVKWDNSDHTTIGDVTIKDGDVTNANGVSLNGLNNAIYGGSTSLKLQNGATSLVDGINKNTAAIEVLDEQGKVNWETIQATSQNLDELTSGIQSFADMTKNVDWNALNSMDLSSVSALSQLSAMNLNAAAVTLSETDTPSREPDTDGNTGDSGSSGSTVGGMTTTDTQISTDRDFSVGGDLSVSGNTNLGGSLTVAGEATFNDNATFNGDVDMNGTLNMNGNTITGVGAGAVTATSTDAINGSQLYEVQQQVDTNSQNINMIGNAVNKLDSRIDRVGAGAAALAALHPLDFDPDAKWDFAAGYGNYRGANAVAVGAYYRPNEDLMFSVGGSMGGGENMVNAGVSVKIGSGSSNVTTSRVAMAKEIKAMRDVVAKQDAQIQKLTAMVNALVGIQAEPDTTTMFPDVPENHWAYEAVETMAKSGLIKGYPDGEFKGDRTMTRYEFAQIVHNAIQAGAEVDARLVQEFAPELEFFRIDTVAQDESGNPTIQRVRVNK